MNPPEKRFFMNRRAVKKNSFWFSVRTFFFLACLLTLSDAASAQGNFYFQSQPFEWVFTNSASGTGRTAISPEGYYYGLFTAPVVTTNSLLFAFGDSYATNSTDILGGAGAFSGGTATVTGWTPGETRAFLIRGWSSNLGHDWTSVISLLQSGTQASGFYGESSIGVIAAGGTIGSVVYPLFIPAIQSFTLFGVPEPSSLALIRFSGFLLLLRRRS